LAKTDPAVGLSEDAIRIRAYQIYEFRNRTNDQAADDWFQAQRELTELLCGIWSCSVPTSLMAIPKVAHPRRWN